VEAVSWELEAVCHNYNFPIPRKRLPKT
jgi:hypothetical protein